MLRIQWHPAFVQAMAIELADYQDVLTFESEHQLTTKPLQIDILIIKKEKDIEIKKNIGRIFRRYNVVEYKSPTDRATIADYDKTQCYSRLYAALNKQDTESMSVTMVATRHPRKLMRHLTHRYSVERVQQGIYRIDGDTSPTQIIVSEELLPEDNLWLNSLRSEVKAEQLEQFTQNQPQTLPMDAYFNVLGEANFEALEELQMRKKEGVIFSEKLDAFFYAKVGHEAEARGETRGETRGKAESAMNILRAKFKRVPKETETAIRAITDPAALDSWVVRAAMCSSMKEFNEALK